MCSLHPAVIPCTQCGKHQNSCLN